MTAWCDVIVQRKAVHTNTPCSVVNTACVVSTHVSICCLQDLSILLAVRAQSHDISIWNLLQYPWHRHFIADPISIHCTRHITMQSIQHNTKHYNGIHPITHHIITHHITSPHNSTQHITSHYIILPLRITKNMTLYHIALKFIAFHHKTSTRYHT